jgi:CHAD domain-containing protein
MSLSPAKSARKRIRKQLKKRTAGALEILSGKRLSDEDVHEARKSLKKARACLRLLRPGLKAAAYRRQNSTLRDAARPLGALRDAKLLPDTLALLAQRHRKAIRMLDLSGLEKQLKSQRAKLRHDILRTGATTLAHSRRLLREARAGAQKLQVRRDNWEVVAPALKQVYRQGRHALAEARDQTSPEAFHEWRKQAKYLRYALETLEPLWPPVIQSLADQAHELTNYLGDDHDLTVLRQKTHDTLSSADAAAITALIERRQMQLRQKAVRLGSMVYEEKPKVFTHRFAEYWKEWRHGRAS